MEIIRIGGVKMKINGKNWQNGKKRKVPLLPRDRRTRRIFVKIRKDKNGGIVRIKK